MPSVQSAHRHAFNLKKSSRGAGEDISSLLTFMFVILPNISCIRKKIGAAKILNIKRP